MLFNSIEFLIFFPLVCLTYYVIPYKARTVFLLICSYFFYMCWNPKYALLMLTSTAITYLSGILISGCDRIADEKQRTARKKQYVALSFISNLLILFFFKYYNLFSGTVNTILELLDIRYTIPRFDVLLPVGISFYTFQALSYTADVYRNDIYAEKNFLKYALFVSFFPQLVAGPIERSKNLLVQISQKHPFDFENVRHGFLLMLYGYFQKIVLSSYLAMVVDAVYDGWTECSGLQLTIATACFAFQIYCDFGGYSNIAIGAAEIMGFRIMDNFNAPYLSRSVSEFWRRWHISLSTWFRDYLYIPLGGNRLGRWRKYLNLMIVFLVSGLWHGAEYHFVVCGGINGLFQVIGDLMKPVKKKVNELLHIGTDSALHRILQTAITFYLLMITWIFFRADSLSSAFGILSRMLYITPAWFAHEGGLSSIGLERSDAGILAFSMIILFISDIFRYRNIQVRDFIIAQKPAVRLAICYAAVMFLLIFGVYGPEYDSAAFIYFQF